MQPSKSMIDYMMELNRLFPKNHENDFHAPRTSYQPRFGQPTPNYSSSSTDSYSPESSSELFNYRSELYSRHPLTETPTLLSATPIPLVRRPIVGRKILSNSECKPVEQNSPTLDERLNIECRSFDPHLSPIKQCFEPHTPPNVKEHKNYMKDSFYELFPGETRGFELKTPVKTPSVYSNMSPNSSILPHSPVNSNFGMFTPPRYTNTFNLGAHSPRNIGANSPSNFVASSPMNLGPISSGACSPMNLGASTSGTSLDGVNKMCTFCRKNGETPHVYMTHAVKEKRGNKNVVTCPILRSHVCLTCGVSGDNAHTITYCPVLRSSNNGMPLKSTTISLKSTRLKSNGKKRY